MCMLLFYVLVGTLFSWANRICFTDAESFLGFVFKLATNAPQNFDSMHKSDNGSYKHHAPWHHCQVGSVCLILSQGWSYMGLSPDVYNCGLRMRRECRESFPRHLLQRQLLVSDPGIHHGTCITHVPWCMPGSLTRGGRENVPGIPGACATRNFTYLARGPCWLLRCKSIDIS